MSAPERIWLSSDGGTVTEDSTWKRDFSSEDDVDYIQGDVARARERELEMALRAIRGCIGHEMHSGDPFEHFVELIDKVLPWPPLRKLPKETSE